MGYLTRRVIDILRKEGGPTALLRKGTRYPLQIARGWYYAVTMPALAAGADLATLIDRAFTGFYGLIRPMQDRSELTSLLKMVSGQKPSVVVEIGTATGGTLFLLARVAAADALIISIDLPCGPFGGGYPGWRVPLYRSFATGDQRIRLVRADSHSRSTIGKVKSFLGSREIDTLFIDGDHTYDGVKTDFEIYAPLVKKGGIIVLHDIARHLPSTGCDVFSFWQEVKLRYRHTECIADTAQTGWGIGVIFVD